MTEKQIENLNVAVKDAAGQCLARALAQIIDDPETDLISTNIRSVHLHFREISDGSIEIHGTARVVKEVRGDSIRVVTQAGTVNC